MSMNPENRYKPPQRIVIPKGMINPHETTIIEIPTKFHLQPIVVAKRKNLNNNETFCSSLPISNNAQPVKNISDRDITQINFCAIPVHAVPQKTCSSPEPNCKPYDMSKTEDEEKAQLKDDLEEFQKARRKLLEDTSRMAAFEESQCEMYQMGGENLTVYSYKPGGKAKRLDPSADREEYSRELFDTLD